MKPMHCVQNLGALRDLVWLRIEHAGCPPRVARATGREIPDLTKREHVCEYQSRIAMTELYESAWLVEFSRSVSSRITYWGKTVEGLGMTEESADALRFSRKQDAEAFIEDNG